MIKFTRAARLAFAVLALGACSSSDPQTLIAKAQDYRKEGNYAGAIIELKNVLQQNPDHAEARYLLGVEYLHAGDVRSAEAELRRALKLGVEPPKVLPALGRSLLLQGKYQEALNETDPARLPGTLSSPEILSVMGHAHLGLGRFAEARQSFDEALVLRPDYADALLGQARLAARENKPDEAARLIERAIASEPKSVEAWLTKGDLHRATADQDGAAAAYRKVLELNPNNIPARLNIASLHIASGKFDEARKEVEQLRKVAPNNPMANYMQALLEFRQKNFPVARDAVQQVLRVAPDHMPSVQLAGVIDLATDA
jgi:putative PEP-CTERM system TPR-repeat lipoprotein